MNGHGNPWDPTSNAGLLIPPMVYIQLKCQVLDQQTIVTGRHTLVNYEAVPFKVDYETDQYVFTPLSLPDPPWLVIRGFIVGSYVLEAYSVSGESLVMWDLDGQEHYRPGEAIIPDTCTMKR